jgi:hypothetical protein
MTTGMQEIFLTPILFTETRASDRLDCESLEFPGSVQNP